MHVDQDHSITAEALRFPTKLKPTEKLIIMALTVQPSQTAAELAAAITVSKVWHVSSALRTLVAMGLVTQHPGTDAIRYNAPTQRVK